MPELDKDFLEKSLDEISALGNSLVREARDEDTALMVATNMCFVAQKIFMELGGRDMTAAQFYAFADRIAGEQE